MLYLILCSVMFSINKCDLTKSIYDTYSTEALKHFVEIIAKTTNLLQIHMDLKFLT